MPRARQRWETSSELTKDVEVGTLPQGRAPRQPRLEGSLGQAGQAGWVSLTRDETTVAPPAYGENDIITHILPGEALRK